MATSIKQCKPKFSSEKPYILFKTRTLDSQVKCDCPIITIPSDEEHNVTHLSRIVSKQDR